MTTEIEQITKIEKSTNANKKYMVNYNNKWIHFGDIHSEHYEDITPRELYAEQNHYNNQRRDEYRNRMIKIRDKNGNFSVLNKNTAIYWTFRFLN